MKKINIIALTVASVPFVLYAAATLKTNSGFFYPTNKMHSDATFLGFGEPNEDFSNNCHLANDYDDAIGTAVYAVGPGEVVSAANDSPNYGSAEGAVGGTIVIKHTKSDDTFFWALYGHVQNISVAAGDLIKSGDKIAEIGSYTAGGVSFPHLHFGINTAGPNIFGYTPTSACTNERNFVDPEPYLLANSPKIPPAETCQAVNDSSSTTRNTIVTTASVLTNDTDTDGDTLSVTAGDATSAEGVTVTNNSDGTFTYTPPIDFTGTDTFNYTITDSNGCSDEGTFTVTVTEDSTTDPTDPTPDTGDDSGSGGGSFHIWSLFFLGLPLLIRRFRKS